MRDDHGSRLGQEVRPLDRVAVYFRDDARLLGPPGSEASPEGTAAAAIHAETGAVIWKKTLDPHRFARITGAPVIFMGLAGWGLSRLYVLAADGTLQRSDNGGVSHILWTGAPKDPAATARNAVSTGGQ